MYCQYIKFTDVLIARTQKGLLMAIRLDELFDKTKRTFELKLIAGKNGLNHIVGWVHLLEDEIILNRFGGQELAVTTGMKSQEPDWLLHVVTSMKKRDCSGLILNTGMYLKNIPQSVIDWCNQNDFPLFAMPWEISCTQLVQEFCTIIMKRAQKEREYGDIFQSIIQGAPLNPELLAPLKNRFRTDSTFQVFCIRIRFGVEDTTAFRQAILHLENHLTLWQKTKRLQSPYLLFEMDDCYTLVINHLPLAYTQEIADQILDQFSYFTRRNMLSLGIGSQVNGIASVKSAFSSARMAAQMAYQTNKKIIDFQQMGFFKILFAADDTTILKSYEQQLLGPLEEHDQHHHSLYLETLRSYIENDRSLMGVAESTFTHRNTVNYRIQNIKKILNNPLKTAQDLFPYQVAFYIRDMKL